MPDSNLMAAFATEPIYLAKLAGAPSRLSRMVEERMRPDDPPIDKTAALPWGGRLSRMEESAELAWQAGEMLVKHALVGGLLSAGGGLAGGRAVAGGVKDLAVHAVKAPFQGARALWKGTSTATKAKAGMLGAGLAVGGAGLAAGSLAGKGVDALSNFASVPEGQERVAHVVSAAELEKQALDIGGVANTAKGFAGTLLGAGKQGVKSVTTGAAKKTGNFLSNVGKVKAPAPAALAGYENKLLSKAAPKVNAYENKMLNKPAPAPAAPANPGAWEKQMQQKNVASRRAGQVAGYQQQVGSTKAQNMVNRVTGQAQVEAPKAPIAVRAPERLERMRASQAARAQPPPLAVAPTTGQVQKPPAAPPPPAIAPPAQPAPMQNMAAKPQQATQPTAAPPANPPPVGTIGQKGQQAAIQSGDAGAAVVQTPQEAGQGTIGKIRGALPWVGGALGAGALGIGAGAAMLGGKATKAMGQEGQFNNSYQGYGAPVAGSASQFGYVNPPGGR